MRGFLVLSVAALFSAVAPRVLAQPIDTLHDGLGAPLALRGVAFDGWLSGEVPHDDTDVRAVRTMGGNCIKLIVPFTLLTRVDPVVREQRVQQVIRMAGYARGAGLGVVLSCGEPAGRSLFAVDRNVRAAFVETWVSLVRRIADSTAGPALRAVIPLEEPSEALSDPAQYNDLCSYMAQSLQEVRPGLAMFLAPLDGVGPESAPVLTYPFVGAICRLPAPAAALERVAVVQLALDWSREHSRPVLIDRVAPTGLPREDWESVLGPCLSVIVHADPTIHLIYDRMRSVDEGEPGIALRFPSAGAMQTEPVLQDLLSRAFNGALPRLREPAASIPGSD